MITVLFFAQLKEELGCDKLELDMPDGATVNDIYLTLQQHEAHWQQIFKDTLMLCAVNQNMADFETVVHAGDEVAFFPPVTGG
jgi:molybdopterin synthase sulfur carrier subunit